MSMVTTKWIQDNAVTAGKVRLENDLYFRARNSDGLTDVNLFKLDGSNIIQFASLPRNSTVPTHDYEFTNKAYVDSLSSAAMAGLDLKAAVRLGTAAPLPTCVYANGTAGVGATLTAAGAGALTVDGVAVALNDRILVKNQANAFENGIYRVSVLGDSGTAFELTRASDFDNTPTGEISAGAHTFVMFGDTNAAEGWVMIATGAVTVGTTDLPWTIFSAGGITAGNGMTQNGRTVNIVAEDNSITVNADSIQVKINAAGALDVTATGLAVAVDGSTIKVNASNDLEALKKNTQTVTLTSTDITNGYIDLAQLSYNNMVDVFAGGLAHIKGTDYTLSTEGGVTRVTFVALADLATLLVAGDVVQVAYEYLG